MPRSRGGSDDPENLRPSCFLCNFLKDNLLPHEWWEYITTKEYREKREKHKGRYVNIKLPKIPRESPRQRRRRHMRRRYKMDIGVARDEYEE